MRTYLPKAYVSAKHTLGSALELSLQEAACTLTKTELAKLIRKTRLAQEPQTPNELAWKTCCECVITLSDNWKYLKSDEQNSLILYLKNSGVI